jgi:hypothetical protein
MKSYLDNWDSIFNRKKKSSFRNMALSDGINRHQKTIIEGNGVVSIITVNNSRKKNNSKKELCPHCATVNLKRIDTWTVKCSRCGFER